jgi:transposase
MLRGRETEREMESRRSYTQEFKDAVVKKVVNRGSSTIQEICDREGILKGTAVNWLKSGARTEGMVRQKTVKKWTAEEKLNVVMATFGLEGERLGTYLREKGLHSHRVEEWRAEIVSLLRGVGKASLRDERDNRIRELEHEVNRKDKALSEASALLILQKKVDLIWGRRDEGKK